MSDNVIILGAGFSYDADIPLLANFIECMWEIQIRGKARDKIISETDKHILSKAIDIRKDLDGYHGRATFNDRNIEDILSILSFNVLGGGKREKSKFQDFIKAISTTIELSCSVKHPGFQGNEYQVKAISDGDSVYRKFWSIMLNWYKKEGSFPTIITLNYDLVLERSLLQLLINTTYDPYKNKCPIDSFVLDYSYPYFERKGYEMHYVSYDFDRKLGTTIKEVSGNNLKSDSPLIEILKLHGSLNFPQNRKNQNSNKQCWATPTESPYIIPPISNKASTGAGEDIWQKALRRLRKAKNVVFVGYSLPKTDTYIQFFLKAALGPNLDLNRIYIFDPLLWSDRTDSELMQKRFEDCFAQQLRKQIVFKPDSKNINELPGSTKHFVKLLDRDPKAILF